MDMQRIRITAGSIFRVELGVKTGFFQYIGSDNTQLDSNVIKVFRSRYGVAEQPKLPEVAADAVGFYAHCLLGTGYKLGYWTKAGHAAVQAAAPPLFRDTYDYGRAAWQEPVLISYKWVVWRMNKEMHRVGKLTHEMQMAEIGMVMSPSNIIHRMQHGTYELPFYPAFEAS
ncbi:MAG: hypothetical protein ACRYFK_10110 [Janthinobacterium lividum]